MRPTRRTACLKTNSSRQPWQKWRLLVSFSSYMDETAAQADLILPNHTAFERYDDVVGIPGASFGYYAVSAPVIKPLLDTKHTGDALLALAAGIGGIGGRLHALEEL